MSGLHGFSGIKRNHRTSFLNFTLRSRAYSSFSESYKRAQKLTPYSPYKPKRMVSSNVATPTPVVEEVQSMKNWNPHGNKLFVAPVYTPFTSNQRSIEYALIPQMAATCVDQGFNSILVAGTNGESYSITFAERKKLLEEWLKTEEVKSGKLFLMIQVSCQSIQESIELAEHAAQCDTDNKVGALLYKLPSFFKPPSVQEAADLLSLVANAAPTKPMVYYHFPLLTGINFKCTDVMKVAKVSAPSLVGCKFTHIDMGDFMEAISAGFDMIIGGGDDLYYPALMLGGTGCFSVVNMCGYRGVKDIYECYQKGDSQRALRIQSEARKLFQQLWNFPNGYISVGKRLATMTEGYELGPCRAPVKQTSVSDLPPEILKDFTQWENC